MNSTIHLLLSQLFKIRYLISIFLFPLGIYFAAIRRPRKSRLRKTVGLSIFLSHFLGYILADTKFFISVTRQTGISLFVNFAELLDQWSTELGINFGSDILYPNSLLLAILVYKKKNVTQLREILKFAILANCSAMLLVVFCGHSIGLLYICPGLLLFMFSIIFFGIICDFVLDSSQKSSLPTIFPQQSGKKNENLSKSPVPFFGRLSLILLFICVVDKFIFSFFTKVGNQISLQQPNSGTSIGWGLDCIVLSWEQFSIDERFFVGLGLRSVALCFSISFVVFRVVKSDPWLLACISDQPKLGTILSRLFRPNLIPIGSRKLELSRLKPSVAQRLLLFLREAKEDRFVVDVIERRRFTSFLKEFLLATEHQLLRLFDICNRSLCWVLGLFLTAVIYLAASITKSVSLWKFQRTLALGSQELRNPQRLSISLVEIDANEIKLNAQGERAYQQELNRIFFRGAFQGILMPVTDSGVIRVLVVNINLTQIQRMTEFLAVNKLIVKKSQIFSSDDFQNLCEVLSTLQPRLFPSQAHLSGHENRNQLGTQETNIRDRHMKDITEDEINVLKVLPFAKIGYLVQGYLDVESNIQMSNEKIDLILHSLLKKRLIKTLELKPILKYIPQTIEQDSTQQPTDADTTLKSGETDSLGDQQPNTLIRHVGIMPTSSGYRALQGGGL